MNDELREKVARRLHSYDAVGTIRSWDDEEDHGRWLYEADAIVSLITTEERLCTGEHYDKCLNEMRAYIAEEKRRAFAVGSDWRVSHPEATGDETVLAAVRRYEKLG